MIPPTRLDHQDPTFSLSVLVLCDHEAREAGEGSRSRSSRATHPPRPPKSAEGEKLSEAGRGARSARKGGGRRDCRAGNSARRMLKLAIYARGVVPSRRGSEKRPSAIGQRFPMMARRHVPFAKGLFPFYLGGPIWV